MKDFKNDSTLARFGRDKRQRISSTERVEPRSRNEYGKRESEREARPQRASYNPHFTEDNRPTFERKPRTAGSKPAFGGRKPATKRFGASAGEHEEQHSFSKQGGEKRFGGKGRFENNGRGKFEGKGGKFAPKGKFGPKREEKPKSYPKYDLQKQVGEMRLNRYIAQSGLCSRREADDFITAGLVTVNGVIVTELGSKVMPGDVVKFADSKIEGEKRVYLVLNKPKGYVTSLEDPHAEKTVMDLVKGACTERIYPVGRLDKNSLGLLLFTNDGDMTKQLTHPTYQKTKIYQVTLDKPLTRADMDQIAEGIVLEDGEIHADEIAYVKDNKKEVGIEIHSGRNRIVRRIFEFLGYSVQKLDRVYYAGLTKKNLKRGQWRFLTREEVDRLKSGRYE